MWILRLIFAGLTLAGTVFSSNDFQAKHPIENGIYLPINLENSTHAEIAYYREIKVPAYTISEFSIRNLSTTFGFAIFQVHACLYNITLSYNKTLQPDMNYDGSNLGLTVYPSPVPQSVYIYNNNFFTPVNVSIAVIVYAPTVPLPGACNLVNASVHNSPDLLVQNALEMISVDTPPAALSVTERVCKTQPDASMQYSGFHIYLKNNDFTCRTYFDGIKQMLTVKDVRKNGKLGGAVPLLDTVRRTYISVPGTGIVFASLVQGRHIEDVAAYVPAYSISCSPTFWETNCNIFASPEYRVLTIILIVVGVIRGYFGSAAAMVGCAIDGFVVGLFGAFFVIYYSIDEIIVSEEALKAILISSGTITALVMCGLLFWMPALQWLVTSMSNVIVGYLLGSFSLYVIGSTDLTSGTWWWEHLLLASILLTFVFLPPCANFSGIVLSASWGTFAIIQAMMFLLGTHGSYMIINSIRRTSVRGYRYTNSSPALGSEDVWLYFIWVLLAVSAMWVQLKMRRSTTVEPSSPNDSDEQTPLISRWTNGSDDVFESPDTNNSLMARIRRLRNVHA